MTRYTERRILGYYEDDGSEPGWPPGRGPRQAPEPEALPLNLEPEPDVDPPDLRTHQGLDTAAEAAGYTWTRDNLTAQAKREELANLE